MSAVPILDLDAQAVAARYLGPAEAYIRLLLPDATTTVGQVARRAEDLAATRPFQAAIDAARAEADGENRRLRVENRRLRGQIVGARAAIRNAQHVDKPGWAAVALNQALCALETSGDDELEACIARHPAGRALPTDQP